MASCTKLKWTLQLFCLTWLPISMCEDDMAAVILPPKASCRMMAAGGLRPTEEESCSFVLVSLSLKSFRGLASLSSDFSLLVAHRRQLIGSRPPAKVPWYISALQCPSELTKTALLLLLSRLGNIHLGPVFFPPRPGSGLIRYTPTGGNVRELGWPRSEEGRWVEGGLLGFMALVPSFAIMEGSMPLGDSRGSSSAPRWWEPYRGPRDFHRASARRSLAGRWFPPASPGHGCTPSWSV
ncbi:hypothetical protein OPV22_004690 [Ensete ventricosum]|uniref:Uncharacterized protein n=1 Tax=Ensete ventricosum TaxID=4639 RepID=A0AAV8RKJ5_ENSVE|nr:hypothetical protein OPV22_004690 [Ensete ventricosum]